jgi:UDP-N-acetyl-D-glucosamine dehydrogenase
MTHLDILKGKLADKTALIGIVGLGYVGLPLMLRYAEAKYRVLGIDIDNDKITQLNLGQSYIEHIGAQAIAAAKSAGFEATTDFAQAAKADAIILCVPTPLNKHREPDLSHILSTIDALLPHLRTGQVISLESTTYPGTTEEELLPPMQSTGLTVGKDIFLVYSPEREDPGNGNFTTRTIPKLCGGITPSCLEAGLALYGQVIDTLVPVSSTRTAEMTKLLENIHRAVNIGLVNEMKIVCDRMEIDIHEVIRAAATKPFGFVPYYPGPGLGGHCIPIDPFYLTWKAREYGLNTKFIELAGEVNRAMPEWVAGKVVDALNAHGKSVKGSKILVLGTAYKKNVDDMRESPAIAMMRILEGKGAAVSYSDPHVPRLHPSHDQPFALESVTLSAQTLAAADCVLIATNHGKFDYDAIKRHSRLIVDSRGVYLEPAAHIVKA